MRAYGSPTRFGTRFITIYGGHEHQVGTFAGMMMAWTNAPVGSFGTRDQPATWESA